MNYGIFVYSTRHIYYNCFHPFPPFRRVSFIAGQAIICVGGCMNAALMQVGY